MLHRPVRTSLTETEILALKRDNNQLKLQLKELEEDYKELKGRYERDVLKVQQADEVLRHELRETYEKWSVSKSKITELNAKLKAVACCSDLERPRRLL